MRLNRLSFAAERHISELRDTADQEYILARIAFRYELDAPFLWLSHQAIEKYLKALLLFNGRTTHQLKHNLPAAFMRVAAIRDIPFGFPPSVENFIEYLDRRADRYAERSYTVSTRRFAELDATVWYLRRFCVNLRGNSERRLNWSAEKVQKEIDRRASPEFVKTPYRYRLTHGYLEELREKGESRLRAFLTWENLFFARRRRLSPSAARNRSVNSWLALHPEIISELQDRLLFSNEAKERLRAV